MVGVWELEDIEVDQRCRPCIMHAPIAEYRVLCCCCCLIAAKKATAVAGCRADRGLALSWKWAAGGGRRRRTHHERIWAPHQLTIRGGHSAWMHWIRPSTPTGSDSWVLGGIIPLRLKVRMTVLVSTIESAIDTAEDTER